MQGRMTVASGIAVSMGLPLGLSVDWGRYR
jgi:hypothetical protein